MCSAHSAVQSSAAHTAASVSSARSSAAQSSSAADTAITFNTFQPFREAVVGEGGGGEGGGGEHRRKRLSAIELPTGAVLYSVNCKAYTVQFTVNNVQEQCIVEYILQERHTCP